MWFGFCVTWRSFNFYNIIKEKELIVAKSALSRHTVAPNQKERGEIALPRANTRISIFISGVLTIGSLRRVLYDK